MEISAVPVHTLYSILTRAKSSLMLTTTRAFTSLLSGQAKESALRVVCTLTCIASTSLGKLSSGFGYNSLLLVGLMRTPTYFWAKLRSDHCLLLKLQKSKGNGSAFITELALFLLWPNSSLLNLSLTCMVPLEPFDFRSIPRKSLSSLTQAVILRYRSPSQVIGTPSCGIY